MLRGVTFAGAFKEILHQVKPTLAENIRFGLSLTPERIARAWSCAASCSTRMRAFLERYDVLAAPVTQVPPFSVDEEFPRAIAGVEMGSYLEWFRSCSRITVTSHPAVAGAGRVHAGRAADRAPARRAPSRRGRAAGARSGLHRGDRAVRAQALALMPWPSTPPTAAHRAAFADARSAPVLAGVGRRTRARRWRGSPRPTCASSAAASPGCGRRCTRKALDPARDVVLLEAETAGFGASGRNGGFCVASLTHGIENGLARFPEEMEALERLGLENFDALAADLDTYGIACDFEPTGELDVFTDELRARMARGRPGAAGALRLRVRAVRRGGESAPRSALPPTSAGCGSRPARRSWTREAGLRAARGGAAASACACTSTRPCTTCASAAAGRRRARVADRRRARHARGASCSPRAPIPPLLRAIRRGIVAGLRLRADERAADADKRASIGWKRRQGIGDLGTRFHYYRLTADGLHLRRLDAVYRYGGPVSPRHDDHDPTFAKLSSTSSTPSRSSEGVRFTHCWAARSTPLALLGLLRRRLRRQVDLRHGYTGLGVAAAPLRRPHRADLLDGRDTYATRLRYVRAKPVPSSEPRATRSCKYTRGRCRRRPQPGSAWTPARLLRPPWPRPRPPRSSPSCALGVRAAVLVGDDACDLVRQAGGLAQLLGDLRDLLGRVVGREDVLLGREVVRREALGGLVDDDEVLARLGVGAVQDGDDLAVVFGPEAVDLEVLALFDVRLASGILAVGIRGDGNSLPRSAPVSFSSARA